MFMIIIIIYIWKMLHINKLILLKLNYVAQQIKFEKKCKMLLSLLYS